MRDFNLANWFGRKLFERARQAEAQAQAYDSFILEFRRVMRGTPITQQCLELEASE
jgi:type II secretory pathway pseudopilin PulG